MLLCEESTTQSIQDSELGFQLPADRNPAGVDRRKFHLLAVAEAQEEGMVHFTFTHQISECSVKR
jgi:hypothetical protein